MDNDALLFLELVAGIAVLLVSRKVLKWIKPAWFYERLPRHQLQVIAKYFQFYGRLSPVQQRRFEHLVAGFVNDKEWKGVGVEVKEEMQVMIGASAAQLMFGLPDLTLMHFDRVLVYGHAFLHHRTGQLHQGEVNPQIGVIRISWAHYLKGYARPFDGQNVALHELAHALWFEDFIPNAEDDFFDRAALAKWKTLVEEEVYRIRQGRGGMFGTYAGTNAEEFFAVAVEHFFEQPGRFRDTEPELYQVLSTLLKQDPAAGIDREPIMRTPSSLQPAH
jgi:Mlc titration factor MtfA (ptsG expression regulator)